MDLTFRVRSRPRKAASAAASGRYGEILPHIAVVLAYDLALFALAIWTFHRNTRGTD